MAEKIEFEADVKRDEHRKLYLKWERDLGGVLYQSGYKKGQKVKFTIEPVKKDKADVAKAR